MRKYYAHGIREYQSFGFHPYNIILFVALFGLSAMFVSLTVAFIYTRVQSNLPPLQLPYIFLVNTFVLILSSLALIRAKKAFENDDLIQYKQMLTGALVLAVIFLARSDLWLVSTDSKQHFAGYRQFIELPVFTFRTSFYSCYCRDSFFEHFPLQNRQVHQKT